MAIPSGAISEEARARRPSPTPFDEKPRLRGRFHQIAFFLSLPLGIGLVALAPTPTARIATVVYVFTLWALYGTSASFHRRHWQPNVWHIMRRLDHSAIFFFIAGSYTPIALLALDPPWSTTMLATAWAAAGIGAAVSLLGIGRHRAVSFTVYPLYLVLGWFAAVATPQLITHLSVPAITLLAVGGIFYTLGFVVLMRRRPNPVPTVFEYHEVWHTLVVGGSACHFAMIVLVLLDL